MMDEQKPDDSVQECNMSEVNSGSPSAPVEASGDLNLDSAVQEVENELSGISDGLGGDSSDDSGMDSENEIDAAEATGQISKKEAIQLKKKLKIKVDGQEMEEELSWDDEDGLKKHVQKSKAFDKRAKEHAEYKSQVEQFFNALQTDLEGTLERMGINLDDMSEKRLSRKLEELKKSPEELEREKMQKELEDYKKKEKEARERAEKAELERLKNEQSAQIENEITEALDSANSILPKKNPAVLQRIAQAMVFAINKGYTNVTAKDVIPFVEQQYRQEYAEMMRMVPDDVFESLATKERLTNYRKAQVKAKAPSVQKPQIKDTGAVKTKKEAPKVEPFSTKSLLKLNPNK